MELPLSFVLLIGQMVIGIAFVSAGVLKLRAVPATARAILDYRLVPAAVAPLVARILGLAEVLVGIGLLFWVPLAVPLGLALIAALSAAAGSALLRGLKINCRCFGDRERLSRATMERNGVIAGALAASLLVDGIGPSPLLPHALRAPLPSFLAAWVAAGLVVWLGVQSLATRRMARAIGQLEKQLQSAPSTVPWEGLPLGASAPLVSGFDLQLKQLVTSRFSQGRRALIFVDSNRLESRRLLGAAQQDLGESCWPHLLVIAQGTHKHNEMLSALAPKLRVISDPAAGTHRAYQVQRTPYAFLVEGGEVHGQGYLEHWRSIQAWLDHNTNA